MDKKISFSAQDNGVVSFIQKMKGEAKVMYNDIAKEAQKQGGDQKAQFKFIQDYIKGLKDQLKLEKEITNEKIKRSKELKDSLRFNDPERSAAEGKQIRLEEEAKTQNEQAKRLSYLESHLKERKEEDKESKPEPPASSRQVFNAVLLAGLVRDIFGVIKQMPEAETQVDLLQPAASAIGAGIGAAAGLFSSPGAVIAGKEVGSFTGSAFVRSLRGREQFNEANAALAGLTGQEYTDNPFYNFLGFDKIKSAQLQRGIADARGGAGGASLQWDTLTSMGLMKGYNIDQNTLMQNFANTRSGGGDAIANIQRIMAGAITEGVDRSRLGDAIKNQTALTQLFSQTKTDVDNINVNKSLLEFNRMGGMFRIGDPRSMQNIQSISQDLSAPSTNFAQALNYSVLRRLNPNADVFQLLKKQEQGLQTPGFLKGVIGDITQMGGSETFQKLMLKSRLPSLSYEAVDTLFANRNQIDKIGKDGSKLGLDTILGEGMKLTPRLQKDAAEISDAFKDNMAEGLKILRDKFVKELTEASEEVAKILAQKVEQQTAKSLANTMEDVTQTGFSIFPKWVNDKYQNEYRKNAIPPGRPAKRGSID